MLAILATSWYLLAYLHDVKPVLAFMLYGLGISSAREKANQSEVKLLHTIHYSNRGPITYAEVKNISSAGFARLTPLLLVRTVMKSFYFFHIAMACFIIKSIVFL